MIKPKRGASKTVIIFGVVAVVLIIAGIATYVSQQNKAVPFKTMTASRVTVSQEVDVTGRVVPEKEVNLAFEQSGRVKSINFVVGERVEAGAPLATLDASTVNAQLSQAEAMVRVEEAKLAELMRGTRSESVQIYETKVANAQTSLDAARKGLIDALQDAYTKTDDAIYSKTDEIFDYPRGNNPKLVFDLSDASLRISIENKRFELTSILASWKTRNGELNATADVAAHLTATKNNLETVRTYFDNVASAVNGLVASGTLSATTITTYKTNTGTARANINLAIASLQSAEEKWAAAQSALAVANNELSLQKAGTTAEQIAAETAALASANANVSLAEAQVAKTVLVSPISGVITALDIKRGEIASMNAPVISIMSDSMMKIESYVPEADMTKLKVGDTADVHLDAYGSGVLFAAHVVAIDPAETMKEGVPTYKTTLKFDEADARVKSGMTADVRVFGGKKENVIAVPGRALESNNGKTIARILRNGVVVEVPVETGMKGADGMVEIISGVAEGDQVITYSAQ